MKVGTLFDLMNSADIMLDLFENVETTEQVVSRCERLKRGQYPDELLDSVYDLRAAVEAARADTLEMHSPPSEADDLEDDEGDEDKDDQENEDLGGDPDLDALLSDEGNMVDKAQLNQQPDDGSPSSEPAPTQEATSPEPTPEPGTQG